MTSDNKNNIEIRKIKISVSDSCPVDTWMTVKLIRTSSIMRVEGAGLSEWLRRSSNKPDVVGSIPVTTEFFLISCDSNQVPKWFGAHYNLEVPL